MEINDNLFDKIEKKTNVKKESIISLASRLNENNMKDEDTILGIINDLSKLTGKEVSDNQKDKILSIIKNDKVPNNLDKYIK